MAKFGRDKFANLLLLHTQTDARILLTSSELEAEHESQKCYSGVRDSGISRADGAI